MVVCALGRLWEHACRYSALSLAHNNRHHAGRFICSSRESVWMEDCQCQRYCWHLLLNSTSLPPMHWAIGRPCASGSDHAADCRWCCRQPGGLHPPTMCPLRPCHCSPARVQLNAYMQSISRASTQPGETDPLIHAVCTCRRACAHGHRQNNSTVWAHLGFHQLLEELAQLDRARRKGAADKLAPQREHITARRVMRWCKQLA